MSNETPTGRDLDIAIAKVCGWTNIEQQGWLSMDYYEGTPRTEARRHQVARYSTDIAAAMTLGADAERLGIEEEFYHQLWKNVAPIDMSVPEDEIKATMALIHASAHDRAVAFYAAWRAKEGT